MNVFPIDFSELKVIRLIDNSIDGQALIDVETKYANDELAYLFHLELNPETNSFTSFTYEPMNSKE